MTIEKYNKMARVLLIVCFFIPLVGIFPDIYNLYFLPSTVPKLAGMSIIMALYNLPLFLLAGIMYVVGSALEVRRKLNISVIFFVISGLVSIGSIIAMSIWAISGFFS